MKTKFISAAALCLCLAPCGFAAWTTVNGENIAEAGNAIQSMRAVFRGYAISAQTVTPTNGEDFAVEIVVDGQKLRDLFDDGTFALTVHARADGFDAHRLTLIGADGGNCYVICIASVNELSINLYIDNIPAELWTVQLYFSLAAAEGASQAPRSLSLSLPEVYEI